MAIKHLLQENEERLELEDGSGFLLLESSSGKVGGSYDGWLGPASQAVEVKPWRNLPEESELKLLLQTSPRMGQLFKKNLSSLPRLKQHVSKLYDILFNPISKSFNDLKFTVASNILTKLEIPLGLGTSYESPIIEIDPRTSTEFRRTLYGKKLHTTAIMRMVEELLDDDNETVETESFRFDESASAWRGTKQYNDAAKILTFVHSSSFVGQVVWEKANKEMIIVLGDSVYNFCSVPRAIYDGFRKAGSKGRFFNQNIKGLWDC